jgi:branched-chain amino acid transport system ATP-binding protein
MLRVMSGLIGATTGDILLDGASIARERPDTIVRRGIAHCPEERRIWPELTVHENLALGAFICRDRAEVKRRLEAVLTRFPRLRERSAQMAGTLSGGEQQMVAIAAR